MGLTRILTGMLGLALLAGCAGTSMHGEQENMAERFTADLLPVAFPKLLDAARRQRVLIVASDAQMGTAQGTAYRGKVVVYIQIDTKGGKTRMGAVSRMEPGTFSHGGLDLSDRILAAYREEP